MICMSLTLRDFRNIESETMVFDEGVNIFLGRNGQGKTNILEAMWLFSGNKSFRSACENDFIRLGQSSAAVGTEFFKNGRKQSENLKFTAGKNREWKKNGVKIKPSEALGVFGCVLFFPEHLLLIKSGPEERRKFLDTAISQIKPQYDRLLKEYTSLLSRRNFVLKSQRQDLLDTLELYDLRLAKIGGIIAVTRRSYLQRLSHHAKKAVDEISSGKEKAELLFKSFCGEKDSRGAEEELMVLLEENRREDLRLGYTSAGCHRDDFSVTVNGLPAKTYASQGQQRSCVMALKLAEAELLTEETGETPVMLFDDVFSELDYTRKSYITEKIRGKQVFITACEKGRGFKTARVFRVENGKIRSK